MPNPLRNRRVLNRDGSHNSIRRGVKHRAFQDLYHRLLTTSWPKFSGLVGITYFLVNAVFGLGYFLCGEAALQGMDAATPREQLMESFFFSVQTLATIGYGKLSPHGLPANLLVTIEALVGLMGLALATGLIFARFSRPTARVLFSKWALISKVDGVPTLALRIANERESQIVEAQVSIVLLRTERTAEGETYREIYDLKLERSRTPIFSYTWTIMHPITSDSPLHQVTKDSLERDDVEMVISITGTDDVFSQTVHARYSYLPEEFLWDKGFQDMLSWDADGMLIINLEAMHEVRDLVRT